VIYVGALCGAALNRNPRAAAQLFGLTDEAEVQKFTTFLKRFGCKCKQLIK
jgi:hypothetical protein